MDLIENYFANYFDFPSKQEIFEAVVIRDYRMLVALIMSFVLSAVLVVFDVRYWWTYEKSRRQITLLPQETQVREQGSGVEPAPPDSVRHPTDDSGRVEELFVAAVTQPSSSTATPRSRRRRPHHPFAQSNSCSNKIWDDL